MVRIRVCLRWAAAAAILMLLLLLAWQCVDIYQTGTANVDETGVLLQAIYTREDVAARLKALSVPIFVGIAVIVAAMAAHAGHPAEAKTPGMTASNRLRLMRRRVRELPPAALREERLRIGVYAGTGAVLLVCAVFVLLYLLDGSHFASWDLETVMGEMMTVFAPWTALALAAVYASGVLRDKSMQRECDALKTVVSSGLQPQVEKQHAVIPMIRMVLLTAAVLFIVLGVMNGGLYDVLVKAINICTECIGLG